MSILSLAPLRRPPPAAVCDAGDAAANHALAASATALGADDGGPRACGWFDSSWELRQGLVISELPEAELPVAALWFADLVPALLPALAAESAWLQ